MGEDKKGGWRVTRSEEGEKGKRKSNNMISVGLKITIHSKNWPSACYMPGT